jgi:hypothetical protein
MFAMIDLRGEQPKSTDPGQLHAHLQQLVGEPFLHLRFSYGDEMTLHFGTARPYDSPRMNGRVKGSYILGMRASNWYLKSSSPPVLVIGSAENAEEGQGRPALTKGQLETGGFVRPGAVVVSAVVRPVTNPATAAGGFGLSLLLSDGSAFLVTPEAIPSDSAESPLADWELFTPYERLLRAGPGLEWSYLSTRRTPSPQPV